MTHLDIFGQFRPLTIGFDRYFDELNRLSNHTQTNYPPHQMVLKHVSSHNWRD